MKKNEIETINHSSTADVVTTESKKSKINPVISRTKRKLLKHTNVLRVLIIASVLAVFVGLLLAGGKILSKTKLKDFLETFYVFAFTPAGEIDTVGGRTNVLILGKGGDDHESPDLTDTIMFVSVSHSDKKISLLSLPRDIWIPDLRAKLNSVYYWGNKKVENGGLILSKSVVEEVVGQPIQYGVVIDFSGFKKIIDVLGGIDVDVKNEFRDEKYPIPRHENDLCGGDPVFGCRYETVYFKKGVQLMDGETALKFVRSRNAVGDEGTDLARAGRQQRVFEGIKNKTLSRKVILSPKKTIELKDVILSSIETDIPDNGIVVLIRKFLQKKLIINSFILDEDLLENPPYLPEYDNLYVFIPNKGSEGWSEIHKWVKCILVSDGCDYN